MGRDMMNKSCPHCKKTFVRNETLKNHVDKKLCEGKDFKCDICGSYFISKITLSHHKKKCDIKNKKECIITRKTQLTEREKKAEEAQKKAEEEKKKFEEGQKELDNIKRDIKLIGMQMSQIVEKNNTSPTNKTINNNYSINANFIMIPVAFGTENFDKLNQQEIMNIYNSGTDIASVATKKLHFNKNLPEYHNIRLLGETDEYGQFFDGFKWCTKPVDDLAKDLCDKNVSIALRESRKYLKSSPKKLNNFFHNLSLSLNDEVFEEQEKKVKKYMYTELNNLNQNNTQLDSAQYLNSTTNKNMTKNRNIKTIKTKKKPKKGIIRLGSDSHDNSIDSCDISVSRNIEESNRLCNKRSNSDAYDSNDSIDSNNTNDTDESNKSKESNDYVESSELSESTETRSSVEDLDDVTNITKITNLKNNKIIPKVTQDKTVPSKTVPKKVIPSKTMPSKTVPSKSVPKKTSDKPITNKRVPNKSDLNKNNSVKPMNKNNSDVKKEVTFSKGIDTTTTKYSRSKPTKLAKVLLENK